MKTLIIIFVLVLSQIGFAQDPSAQDFKGYTSPEELVTLSANLPFSSALELLSKVSELKSGRKIVSTVQRTDPIGVEIPNMQYEKALLIIVQYANLLLEKKEDVFIVKRKPDPLAKGEDEAFVDANTREVKISAVFFEMDTDALRERGINWQFLLSKKGMNIGTGVTTTGPANTTSTTSTTGTTSDAVISNVSSFSAGSFFGEAVSLFRFIESQKLGEVIASPSITVRDKIEGKIQVGSDFSIKQKDFAGNVIDVFFQTGSIITVTPKIYNDQGIDYTLLKLEVERSTGFPSAISTEIQKTKATTQVLMLNGEETVIGGLFSNEQKTERIGIPFLKDLPWWVLGLRYVTGSDKITVTKKELVIVVKIDLVPTLKERLAFPNGENVIKQELDSYRNKVKYYNFDLENKEK
ncbi:MAG: type II and III secretion system protein [Ignavibacteriaceae bacterium]|nr:type II and III secretion system protein [Ignavibacteriaceae bacterium]